MMVSDFLSAGRENARTGKELSHILNCNIRDITAWVESERRKGIPICASSGDCPGYYLAADADELENYCKRLHGREKELHKTRQALIKVLDEIRTQKSQ